MGSVGASSRSIRGRSRWASRSTGVPFGSTGEFLSGTTRDGDPTLLHGYAITGHVAQGLTVDHSLVLASGGMSSEWAYVALSRGRQTNRLYVAEREDDARAEFAPVEERTAGAVERLTRALQSSDAQVLAIDSGRPADRATTSWNSPTRPRATRARASRPDVVARPAAAARGGAATRSRGGGEGRAGEARDGRAGARRQAVRRPSRDQEADAKRRHEAMAERATQRVLGRRHEREL